MEPNMTHTERRWAVLVVYDDVRKEIDASWPSLTRTEAESLAEWYGDGASAVEVEIRVIEATCPGCGSTNIRRQEQAKGIVMECDCGEMWRVIEPEPSGATKE